MNEEVKKCINNYLKILIRNWYNKNEWMNEKEKRIIKTKDMNGWKNPMCVCIPE